MADMDSVEVTTKCNPTDTAIFVNPDSREELELGTRMFPYKDIVAPLKEILRNHMATTEDIVVFVKEGTTSYFNEKMVTLVPNGSVSLT